MGSARDPSLLLAKTAHVQVLLAVIAGWDYASSIAKLLGKKQPTVTEQLADLMSAGLIKKGERGKAQRFAVNWDSLNFELYDFMDVILSERASYREEAFAAQVNRAGPERIVPREFFKVFLREYFLRLREHNGIKKTFSEICISMFKALDEMKAKEFRRLARHFKADPVLLKDVSALIGLEADHIEMLALELYVDELSQKERHASAH